MDHNVLILASASLPADAAGRPRVPLPSAAGSWRCARLEAVPPQVALLLVRAIVAGGGAGAAAPDRRRGGRVVLLSGDGRALAALVAKAQRRPEGREAARQIAEAVRHSETRPERVPMRSGTLPLGRAIVMGILNVTPDSFADGGRHFTKRRAVAHALRMVEEGADIIDVGGESTRPGSHAVPLREELRRVLPVCEALGAAFARQSTRRPLLSIDTTKAEVARRAAAAGADLINDISGLTFDPAMPSAAAESGCALVLSHIQGRPRTMQRSPRYASLIPEIAAFLRRGMALAAAAGVRADRIILDPGLGFGKRFADNLAILRHLPILRSLGRPILVGASRKSFIGAALGAGAALPVGERLEGSLAAEALALAGGADIIRAHDVPQAVRVARLCDAVLRGGAQGR